MSVEHDTPANDQAAPPGWFDPERTYTATPIVRVLGHTFSADTPTGHQLAVEHRDATGPLHSGGDPAMTRSEPW